MSTEPVVVKRKRPLWHWIAGGIGALVVLSMLASMGDDDDDAPTANTPAVAVATKAPATLAPKATDVVGCLPVTDAARDALAADITLGDTGKVEEAAAVKVDPPNGDSGAQWYAFAIRLSGGGADGAIPVWVTTSDPATDGFSGATFAANPNAEALAPYPFPDAVRDWTHGAGGEQVRHAEACAAP